MFRDEEHEQESVLTIKAPLLLTGDHWPAIHSGQSSSWQTADNAGLLPAQNASDFRSKLPSGSSSAQKAVLRFTPSPQDLLHSDHSLVAQLHTTGGRHKNRCPCTIYSCHVAVVKWFQLCSYFDRVLNLKRLR